MKDETINQKRSKEKRKMLTTILKSFYTFVIVATSIFSYVESYRTWFTSYTNINYNSTWIISSIDNKVIYEIVLQNCNKYRKQYQEDQKTFKSSKNYTEKVYGTM